MILVKKLIGILTIILAFSFCLTGCDTEGKNGGKKITPTKGVDIVATLDDEINGDSAWCATFQLVWNDMQDLLTENGVNMHPQPEVVDNLNKQSFKEDMISAEYFYKKFAEASPALKEEIIKGIKEKFNQESEILDQINFSEPEDGFHKYIFYAMLYREFTYNNKFDELENNHFEGSNPSNVDFFGVTEDSKNKSKLLDQLEACYYNGYQDYAIKINTKEGDEVILVMKPEGKTFNEIWKEFESKTAAADPREKAIDEDDEFKMPVLSFNVTKEFTELEDKPFDSKTGMPSTIQTAIQNIQFEIDSRGGRVKSEAVIATTDSAAFPEGRFFYFNDTFAIFLKEKGKDVPYFAAYIDDITKY